MRWLDENGRAVAIVVCARHVTSINNTIMKAKTQPRHVMSVPPAAVQTARRSARRQAMPTRQRATRMAPRGVVEGRMSPGGVYAARHATSHARQHQSQPCQTKKKSQRCAPLRAKCACAYHGVRARHALVVYARRVGWGRRKVSAENQQNAQRKRAYSAQKPKHAYVCAAGARARKRSDSAAPRYACAAKQATRLRQA